jgi:hypothetical protein
MINRSLWNHYLTLISLIWSIIIMIHWMACCFHFINELEIFFDSHSYTYLDSLGIRESDWQTKYIEMLYWAIVKLIKKIVYKKN